jgi:hypothetical protein
MVVILFVVLSFYCIYLNLRLKEIQEELTGLSLDIDTLEIKVYNKMMDVLREIKGLIKSKTVEKSRRRSTKKRSQVPKA